MTVSTTTAANSYLGNGAVATYAFSFLIHAESDLRVTKEDDGGNVSTLTLTTDYTVSGAGNAAGGTITLTAGSLPNGYTLVIARSVDFLQQTSLPEGSRFQGSTIERAFDRLCMMSQQLLGLSNRSIKLPASETAATDLPAASTRAGLALVFDANGNPTVGAMPSSSSATPGPWDSTPVKADGSTEYRILSDREADVINVKDYGAPGTSSANRISLQAAIAAAILRGGGRIFVPETHPYGLKTDDVSTYPEMSASTVPLIIDDHSPASSYAGYPTAYDGSQARTWFFTPQTTSPGQHDGNTWWINGEWSPGLCLNNHANLATVGHPSRSADDNRRANIFIFNDGVATWKIGQGTQAGAGYTDSELSNFTISMFGAPVLGDHSTLIIEREYGCALWNTGSNSPSASHHLKAARSGVYAAIIESADDATSVDVFLKHHNDNAKRTQITNDDSGLRISDPSVGAGLTLNRTSRRSDFGGPVQLASYVRTSLPTGSIGSMIFVTNAIGGASPAWWDGANWISVYSNAAV